MITIRFLSKLAFICNFCFLLSLGMHYFPGFKNGPLASTIIITGNLLSFLVNFITLAAYLIRIFQRKPLLVPLWLTIVNAAFFIFEIILVLK